jgi:ribosome-associated translation inhibitor RaiA/cold shock CspA family protein
MQVPLNITFRNVRKSPAIENLVRNQAAKLERVCDHIVSCRIAVEKPQEHQKSGKSFRVRIDVTVPPEHELIVTREAGEGDLHEQLPTVVRDAFGAMRRRLRKLTEKQHGDVKTHPAHQVGGPSHSTVSRTGIRLHPKPGRSGSYFHKNSLPGNEFDRLEIGTGVQWNEEQGNNGPQATTLRIVDKPARQ